MIGTTKAIMDDGIGIDGLVNLHFGGKIMNSLTPKNDRQINR
jgi:hypothetical protein